MSSLFLTHSRNLDHLSEANCFSKPSPQTGLEAMWRTTIWDSDDSLVPEPTDDSWAKQFKALAGSPI